MTTNRLIVLDTGPFATIDDLEAQEVVLRNQDANAAFDATATSQLRKSETDWGLRTDSKMSISWS